MKTFEVIHNIPSPYRLHLFRILRKELSDRDILFLVHFMARGHSDRPHWKHVGSDFGFPHTFWTDYCARDPYHFNPGLLRYLSRKRIQYLLVGGPWDSITSFFVPILAKYGISVGWYEANTHHPGRVTGPLAFLKRVLLSKYDYIAVPGKEGLKHSHLLLSQKYSSVPRVFLPNIVDETQFVDHNLFPISSKQEIRKEFGIKPDEKLAIWPARLSPEKGITEFLSLLEPQDLMGWKILLLGQGPLRYDIQKVISERKLRDFILLRSYVGYRNMPLLYASSDLFLLPSIRDRNPLSVVEALFSGLPILVSNRIGNFPEALREGLNGWGFDPYDPRSILGAAKDAFQSSKDRLDQMGQESIKIARDFWGSQGAVRRFLDCIGAV